jgi:cation-transporting P-type ATPase E
MTAVAGRGDRPEAVRRDFATADVAALGLTEAEVRERAAAGQVNTAPPAVGRTLGQILRANVLTRFNAILGVLFVLVMIVGPPQDALFGVVLVVNTAIGTAQELRAKRALDRLAIVTAARARVLRDGTVSEIGQHEVVLDDVLELRQGTNQILRLVTWVMVPGRPAPGR